MMVVNRILLKVLLGAAILYCFRKFSIDLGRELFHVFFSYATDVPLERIQKDRIMIEVAVHICFLFAGVALFHFLSKKIYLPPVFLLAILLSPALFEVSGLIYDKTCLLPWNSDKIDWYLPLRMIAIAVSTIFIFRLKKMFQNKTDYIIVMAVFTIYHFIKPW